MRDCDVGGTEASIRGNKKQNKDKEQVEQKATLQGCKGWTINDTKTSKECAHEEILLLFSTGKNADFTLFYSALPLQIVTGF